MSETSLFEAAKSIDLLEHITQHCGGTATHPGSRTTHVNPCPLCGHNDCFTYYMDSNSFKCWSGACDKAGDIINFERARLSLDSNLAAAQSLAAQYGIEDGKPAPITTTPPVGRVSNPAIDRAASTPRPVMESNRAKELRNCLADHFHNELLTHPAPLEYQTRTRGHRLETLKSEKVGWCEGGWGFVKDMKNHGFSSEDLYAVGLLEPATNETAKGKYRPIPGTNFFIYPHRDAAGDTLHFTFKSPDNPRPWQVKKDAADPSWLCFGQTSLLDKEFWLVEGENDRLTLMDYDVTNVAAIIGNTRNKEIIDVLTRSAAGKTIYLAFDPDPAGMKYEARYSEAIIAAGGTCKTIMPSLITFKDDIDAIIRQAEQPEALIWDMAAHAETITTPPLEKGGQGGISSDREASAPPSAFSLQPSDASPSPFTFQNFHVLGEMADNSIAFWSMDNRKAKVYPIAIKNLSLDQLIQIGGREVASRVIPKRTEYTTDDQILFSGLKKELIMEASRTQLGKMQFLGQGIHLLNDKNLLMVNGKSGWIWTGTELIHHPYPLIERKFLEFEEGAEWIDIPALAEALKTMNRAKAFATLTQFLDILTQWTFDGRYDHFTIAGFIIAQTVQAAWDWRPHLWLAGSAGSGKTKLLEFFKAVFGKYINIYEGKPTSEAGLRQVMTSAMRMTCLDEFESNKDRDKIIDLLRSCGRSGEAVKGSPTGKDPNAYRLRHMVMVCSIEIKLDRAAERSRFLICSTKKEMGHKTPNSPTSATCDALKINLTALALWGFREAMELIRNIAVDKKYDTRTMEAIAVPYAMLAVCTDDPAASLKQNLQNYMDEWMKQDAGGIQEDEAALLDDILTANLRIPIIADDTLNSEHPRTITVDRTVSQILAQDPLPKDHFESLESAGIRLTRENALFVSPTKARQELLRNTKWKDLNILDILRRLPGAQHISRRLAKRTVNGVWIPETTWNPQDDTEE